MNDTKVLIEKIKEGIQEKKGKKYRYCRSNQNRRYHL